MVVVVVAAAAAVVVTWTKKRRKTFVLGDVTLQLILLIYVEYSSHRYGYSTEYPNIRKHGSHSPSCGMMFASGGTKGKHRRVRYLLGADDTWPWSVIDWCRAADDVKNATHVVIASERRCACAYVARVEMGTWRCFYYWTVSGSVIARLYHSSTVRFFVSDKQKCR